MFFLNLFARLIALLHSAAAPGQIAAGFALGMLVGLTPSLPLDVLLFLFIILLEVNLGAALFAIALFRVLAYLLDPLLHAIGYFFLVNLTALKGFWTALYNTPYIPYTGFNNTVVLGSLICGLILLVPVYLGARRGIIAYRRRYAENLKAFALIRYIQNSGWYDNYKKLRYMGAKLWQ
jgi:uncharacterized protein (TIGR03546 family)